ncbi:MAG: hypothetical protein PHP70_02000 [Gallionella sp.]|nr:hypothetical protein [Gallionella sp.]
MTAKSKIRHPKNFQAKQAGYIVHEMTVIIGLCWVWVGYGVFVTLVH